MLSLTRMDSDNGGEFLNYHLYKWLKKHGIKQTRSRPYFKNDQAYVEQKNYTHVREFLGYDRLEHFELVERLNELLEKWSRWKNLFCVTMKQESKRREGSRQIRRHHKKSKTPAQRLLESRYLLEEDEKCLKRQFGEINPFKMRGEIRRLENEFWVMRARIYEEERKEELALAGSPPLRSDEPARASKSNPNQVATVSQL